MKGKSCTPCLRCHGQRLRPRGRCPDCRFYNRTCIECAGPFTSRRSDAKRCSNRCKQRRWRRDNPTYSPPTEYVTKLPLTLVITTRRNRVVDIQLEKEG